MKCVNCGQDLPDSTTGTYWCSKCNVGFNDLVYRPYISDHTTPIKYDPVNHPSHYTEGRKYEPIKVIEDWKLDYCLGNALKYISRAGRKQDAVEDLKKAVWYIQREITKLEGE